MKITDITLEQVSEVVDKIVADPRNGDLAGQVSSEILMNIPRARAIATTLVNIGQTLGTAADAGTMCMAAGIQLGLALAERAAKTEVAA